MKFSQKMYFIIIVYISFLLILWNNIIYHGIQIQYILYHFYLIMILIIIFFYRNMQVNFCYRVYLLVDQNMNTSLLHLKVIVSVAKILIPLDLYSDGTKNISEMLHLMLHL